MSLDAAAARLHALTQELMRRYQYRDTSRVCCYGLSISQSHILDHLAREGPTPMQRLADQMRKSISTMTRVVGNLVDRGHVRREVDSADGRVVRVSLTPQGTAVVEAIHRELLAAEKEILQGIPAEQWAGAFKVLEALAAAVRGWQDGRPKRGSRPAERPAARDARSARPARRRPAPRRS